MNETMNYIFRKLRTSEIAMNKVAKELRKQKSSNRNAVIVAGVAVYFAISAEIEQRKQDEKIKDLEKKIEELKHPEGE